MDEKQYIEQRLDHQIEWYSNKSQWNQKFFKRLRIVEILAASTIPFLTGYVTEALAVKYSVGILAVMIAIISGVLALYAFQENWIGYRTTCESLKHEKYLYLTKSEPYHSSDHFPLLVKRVETLISKENTMWSQYLDTSVKPSSVSAQGAEAP
jgi:hypothetical protein